MNPVLVIPEDVVVPSRLDEPDTLRLPEESRLADCIPANVEEAELAVSWDDMVVEPVTLTFPVITAEPPTVRLPVSLM